MYFIWYTLHHSSYVYILHIICYTLYIKSILYILEGPKQHSLARKFQARPKSRKSSETPAEAFLLCQWLSRQSIRRLLDDNWCSQSPVPHATPRLVNMVYPGGIQWLSVRPWDFVPCLQLAWSPCISGRSHWIFLIDIGFWGGWLSTTFLSWKFLLVHFEQQSRHELTALQSCPRPQLGCGKSVLSGNTFIIADLQAWPASKKNCHNFVPTSNVSKPPERLGKAQRFRNSESLNSINVSSIDSYLCCFITLFSWLSCQSLGLLDILQPKHFERADEVAKNSVPFHLISILSAVQCILSPVIYSGFPTQC